jgi:sugar lactone lactonase YvrE
LAEEHASLFLEGSSVTAAYCPLVSSLSTRLNRAFRPSLWVIAGRFAELCSTCCRLCREEYNMNPLAKVRPRCALLFTCLLVLVGYVSETYAAQVLVSDRISNRILRYDADGNFAGVVVDDPNNLDQPSGIALSPDRTSLYVSSQQNNSIVRYDFDGTTATNGTVIINSGINVPSSLLFSEDGQTLYVANLGPFFDGSTVSQFDPNGVSSGADLTGGGSTGRTGMAFDPNGKLMVGDFQGASVLKYNSGTAAFETFIGPNVNLAGAGNLLVHGSDLYVASLSFVAGAGTVVKFDATTGVENLSFNPIFGQDFPASLSLAPDGSGFLLGILGVSDGTGRIDHYSFDGTFLGTFASNSGGDPNAGFSEATGLLTIFDAADFDTDGDVDDNDLGVWESAYGVNGEADADFDGDSDGDDFLIWQRQYTGDLSPLASPATAVPEPASGLLALAFVCMTGCGRVLVIRIQHRA